MSPALLFLDLLILVVGLPLAWTLRDLAPHGLATAGGLSLLARGGAVFAGVERPSADGYRPPREVLRHWNELGSEEVARLDAALAAPECQVAVAAGSASASFWAALAERGWARSLSVPSGTYALTGMGVWQLGEFRWRHTR